MCIFLVQKIHSIKIPQCVFFSCKKCTRLKFAAKVLHFFQIHKKNHKIFYIFSNRVENLVSIHLAGIWIQRKRRSTVIVLRLWEDQHLPHLRTSYIVHRLLAVVLGVVRLFLQLPEEGTHGLFAIRGILLSCESGLVGTDLHQVFRTS